MPIEHRIVARSLGYLQALTNRKKDPILKGVVALVLEDTVTLGLLRFRPGPGWWVSLH